MKQNTSQKIKMEIEKRTNEEFSKLNPEEKKKLSNTYKLTWGGVFSLFAVFFIGCFTYLLIVSLKNLDATIIFFVAFGYAESLGCVIFVIITLIKPSEKCAKSWLKRNISIRATENKSYLTDEYLENNNFKIEKVLPLPSVGWTKQELLIDNTNKKLVIRFGKQYSKILKYTDIQSYEVYENNNSVVKGTAGKAFLGGAFFGLGGMIIGSSMGKAVSNICTNLKLIIRINNFDNPQMVITYINGSKIDKNSTQYLNMKQNIQSICSILEYIINNKTIESQIKTQEAEKNNTKGQLKELKEMLEEGLIAQEEFEQKKKQILGL